MRSPSSLRKLSTPCAFLVEPNLGENADDALNFLGEAIDQPLLCSGDRITDALTYGRYIRATLRLKAQASHLKGNQLLNQPLHLNPPAYARG